MQHMSRCQQKTQVLEQFLYYDCAKSSVIGIVCWVAARLVTWASNTPTRWRLHAIRSTSQKENLLQPLGINRPSIEYRIWIDSP